MKNEWFGKNIKEAIRVIKGMFKEESKIFDCPFCHNILKKTDTMNRSTIFETDNELECGYCYEYYVECPNCKCKGPVGESYIEALKLWNNREE